MNRRRRRPLKLHLKARPVAKVEFRQPPRRSLKIILAGIALALVAIGALAVTGVSLLKYARSKQSGHTQAAQITPTASPVVVGTQNPVPANTPATPRPSVVVTTPAPVKAPVAVTSPAVQPTAVLNSDKQRDAKPASEAVRKTAEQGRREAERKRARLEEMYQKHLISSEAYKKGQDEYRDEMAKYRNRVGEE